MDVVGGFDVAARISVEGEGFDERLFRPDESHREQHQLCGAGVFSAYLLLGHELSFLVFAPLDLDGHKRLEDAGCGRGELFDRGEIDAGVGTVAGGGLFLAVVEFVNLGPLRPRIVDRSLKRWLGEDLDLGDALAAVA